jgi:hypothetical protein
MMDAAGIVGALAGTILPYDALDVPGPSPEAERETDGRDDQKGALEASLAYAEARTPADALAILSVALGKVRCMENDALDEEEARLDKAEHYAAMERALAALRRHLGRTPHLAALGSWYGHPGEA